MNTLFSEAAKKSRYPVTGHSTWAHRNHSWQHIRPVAQVEKVPGQEAVQGAQRGGRHPTRQCGLPVCTLQLTSQVPSDSPETLLLLLQRLDSSSGNLYKRSLSPSRTTLGASLHYNLTKHYHIIWGGERLPNFPSKPSPPSQAKILFPNRYTASGFHRNTRVSFSSPSHPTPGPHGAFLLCQLH